MKKKQTNMLNPTHLLPLVNVTVGTTYWSVMKKLLCEILKLTTKLFSVCNKIFWLILPFCPADPLCLSSLQESPKSHCHSPSLPSPPIWDFMQNFEQTKIFTRKYGKVTIENVPFSCKRSFFCTCLNLDFTFPTWLWAVFDITLMSS